MANKSNGMLFEFSTTDPASYSTLGQLVDITVPSITKDAIEITDHGSAGVREFTGGLIDNGECTCVVNYDVEDSGSGTDNHKDLRDLAATVYETTTNKSFKISFPDRDDDSSQTDELSMTFAGIVTGFEMSTPIDGVIQATFTIKVSGAITYGDAS